MGPLARVSLLILAVGIAPCITENEIASAQQQQPAIKRTELLKAELAGMEGKEMNLWTADLAPGAQTGKHHHPTPRFVIVLEGSVVLEMEGKPPQTYKAGQAFQEPPDVVHILRNASATEPAKGIGIQYAGKGQPLQVDDH